MKVGLQINRYTWPQEPHSISTLLATIARTADTGGFSSLWVMDHFFQISHIGPPEEPMLEAYTTLGYLAGLTKNIKLGTLVTGVIYRNPTLLIKTVTTLDVLSQGRAYLGIGAAWNEEEAVSLGFAFPPVKERFEQLEATLQLAQQMWRDDDKPFSSKHFSFPRPLNHPQAISIPHPKILIGGGGEKKTLHLVAQYADACNLFAALGKDELTRKLRILQEHCQQVGRDYGEIEKTALLQVQEGYAPEEIIKQCQGLAALGFTHVIVGLRGVEKIDPLSAFCEHVIPHVQGL